MKTFEDFIQRAARQWPDKPALVCGSRMLTYAGLWREAVNRAQTLTGREGRVVVFRASQDEAFAVEYLAVHLAGAVAAPMDAHCPDVVFEELRRQMEGARVPVGTADVLHTTGTTGRPKSVIVSHRAICANVDNLTLSQGYTPDHTVVVHGPLNHIGSLSKLQVALSVGATVCLMDGLKDLNAFFDAIDHSMGCVATFLVPAQVQMVLRFGASRLQELSDKIDLIETGAAAIAETDMQQLCTLLPHTRLYNTYASTETGIIATHDFQAGPCEAGCLGRPMRHSHIRIAEDGHVVCSGDTLMSGYLSDQALSDEVLVNGELHTADLGRLDDLGRLRLMGRCDDVINVGGFKVAPEEVEDTARSFPTVSDCLCTVARHGVMGTVLRLLVVCEGRLDARALAAHLKERLEPHKVPLLYTQVESIARTFNGKPDRKHYHE